MPHYTTSIISNARNFTYIIPICLFTYLTSHLTSFQLIVGSNCLVTYSLSPEPPELLKNILSSLKLANL